MNGATRVIFGPRTRLGQALLSLPHGPKDRYVVIARHDADADALRGRDATVVSAFADEATISAALAPDGPLQVHICALGPLHPGSAQQAIDSQNVERDLNALSRVLAAADGRPTQVVLVSTVLALAPPSDRSYYAGWRGVVEQEVRELVAGQGDVSVLYPGRLTEMRDVRHPVSLLYTTYGRLAQLAHLAAQSAPKSSVVGLDARAWLLTRSASLGLSSVTGRRQLADSLTNRAVQATRQPSQGER